MYCDKCRTYYEASLGTGLFCTCCIKKKKHTKEEIEKAYNKALDYINNLESEDDVSSGEKKE